MKKLSVIVAAFAALAATQARAEEAPRKFAIAPFVGAYVPTGDQRDVLDDALLVGVTASYDLHPNLAVLGSFGWAPTQAQAQGLAAGEDLDLFQYDLGVQGQYPIALSGGWTAKPFVGVGVGARTYSFRDLDVDAETDFAGYVALGGSLQYQAIEVSLTARDYLSAFDGLAGEADSSTSNDLSMFASVGMRF
jgi:hypothetical protein